MQIWRCNVPTFRIKCGVGVEVCAFASQNEGIFRTIKLKPKLMNVYLNLFSHD
jgi:hypothetical protein